MDNKLSELAQIIACIDNPALAKQFLVDLCTPQELEAMADRWQVAQLVHQGVPYRKISEHTGASTTTVTRVARALTYGEKGYLTLLERGSYAE